MIQIENADVFGWEPAIRGMRNSWNSWEKSDSNEYVLGANDLALMKKLVRAGTDHRKFMRMITVTCDITAPRYWWTEFDTYKVGAVRNSCSTMHTITAKAFAFDDFSHEHLTSDVMSALENIIEALNDIRDAYIEYDTAPETLQEGLTKEIIWWQLIQLLPSSYNQRSTVQMNYEVLANMYHSRKNHKLDEWREFCKWVETLPYSELITGERR